MPSAPSPRPLGRAQRRRLAFAGLAALVPGAAAPAAPAPAALASSRRSIAAMTEGPFYLPRAWREPWSDWDADLARVQRDGRTLQARGEHLGLALQLADTNGRAVDRAEVEIWQCDALAVYHHPQVKRTPGGYEAAFQGFGASRSGADGRARFRCIRPVPYPGRTPHIHIKIRHVSFGEITSQLFVADEPGNRHDFLWRALDPADRAMLELRLQPAMAESGLRWLAIAALTLPS